MVTIFFMVTTVRFKYKNYGVQTGCMTCNKLIGLIDQASSLK